MSRLALTACLALTLAACASTAEPEAAMQAEVKPAVVASAEAAPAAETASAGDDRPICRKMPVAGSNFKRKVCATKEQWEAEERAGREATGTIQRRNRGAEPSN